MNKFLIIEEKQWQVHKFIQKQKNFGVQFQVNRSEIVACGAEETQTNLCSKIRDSIQ